jgi:hypothetical protein
MTVYKWWRGGTVGINRSVTQMNELYHRVRIIIYFVYAERKVPRIDIG